MKLSIKTRIVVLNTALFGIVLSILAAVLYLSVEHDGIARLDSQLEQFAFVFGQELAGDLEDSEVPDTADISELRAKGPKGIVYLLRNPDGRRIVGTIPSLAATPHQGYSYANISGKPLRCLFAELGPLPGKKYTLLLGAPIDDIKAGLRHLMMALALLIPIGVGAAGLAAFLIIHYSFRPLQHVIQTAQEVTVGNLEKRIALPATRDEIWTLGNVFNAMMSRLENAFISQKRFVADSSHEIRTPLAIIRSELEFAQRHHLETPVKESIDTSLSEIDRLSSLAEGLLTLSRFDAGRVSLTARAMRLDSFVSETIRLAANLAAPKNIRITTSCAEGITARIDPDEMKRALLNILDNAIKFSPERGTVGVSLRIKDADPGTAVISVADQGSGIAAADLPLIFKRFYRADSARPEAGGSGLGLAIAREIINAHKGAISVRSELGKGATFSIELPAS